MEVRASGGKTYYTRYLDAYGAQRNLRIGDASSVTLDAARRRTIEVRSQVANGADPKAEIKRKRTILSVEKFAKENYLPFIRGYKRSWKSDESLLRLHVLPVFGCKRLDAVSGTDITALHHGMKARGYALATCNRVLVLVRYMFNLAKKWDMGVADNPTRHTELFKVDNKRQRFLTRVETVRLFSALRRSRNPCLYHIVKFLLLTGARKREALNARWCNFNREEGYWLIPETKSGKPRPVPIGSLLTELLDALASRGRSEFLFPNLDTGKPYVSIFHTWDLARNQAGLADVRMHDLRHSFASYLVNSGRSLYEVQKLLGHAHIGTSQRYAHLSNETMIQAVDSVGSFIGEKGG